VLADPFVRANLSPGAVAVDKTFSPFLSLSLPHRPLIA
jgi:hypothetical protein